MSETIINGIIEESREIGGTMRYAIGAPGADGIGISDISKTSTEGKVDTYTITLTDGTTKTFTVTNGDDGANGISVSTASINTNGHLIVTLSDGTSIDAGVAKGDSGVYIGTTPPTDPSIKVWIDTSGEAGDVEMTSNKVTSISSESTDTQYPSAKAVAEAVSAEQSRANNTFANALKGSKNGSAILIDDVSPVTHETGVKVRSKNLFDKDMPFTDDNKVTEGAASGYLTYFIQLQPNTKYYAKCFAPVTTDISVTILSSNKAVNSEVFEAIILSKQLTGWKTELVLTTDDTGRLYVGNNANNVNKIKEILSACNLQIELGTTATNYTPYVPDLTAVKVKRCGKNLLPYPYYETTKTVDDTLTFTDNGDGSITVNGTAKKTSVFQFYSSVGGSKPMNLANRTITISGCPSGGSLQSYFLLFSYGGNSYQDFGNGITKTPNADITAVQLRIAAGATVNNLTFRPQIELGTTATDYEPYKECAEYTPTADGTVNGITSLYPNTTLMTDTDGVIIDCEYNRDINKAFAALEAAIATKNS